MSSIKIKAFYIPPEDVKQLTFRDRMYLRRLARIGVNIIKREIDKSKSADTNVKGVSSVKRTVRAVIREGRVDFEAGFDYLHQQEVGLGRRPKPLTKLRPFIPKSLRGTHLIFKWASPDRLSQQITGMRKTASHVSSRMQRNRFIRRGVSLANRMVRDAYSPDRGAIALRAFTIKLR